MKKSIFLGVLLLFGVFVFSQENTPSFTATSSTLVIRPAFSQQNPVPPISESNKEKIGKKNKRWVNYPTNFDALPNGMDALVQEEKGTKQGRQPIQNFEGAQQEGAYSAWSVPDPTGAVGPNHYIHSYNSGFAIFDKEGNTLLPHSSLGMLWPGETTGDPVVLYDRYVDKFVVTQFSDGPNGILFAICQGPDPVNDGWFTYRFNLSSFPDYPKYSIWHDGYYITANKSGNVLYAVERDKMTAGEPTAQIVGFDLPNNNTNNNTVFAALAMNSVGPNLPDASKPGYVVYLQDDAWASGPDHLKIWEVELDWTNTANSTVSIPAELNTTPFDSFTATFGAGEIPQPNTSQKIDGITGVVSYMCNYWNYGSHNAATLNFNVDVNNDDTILGIRWFELREDTGDWSIYQEGTYAPNDGIYRFMGSMSLDINGNIGMGFIVGNSTTHPSLRYTGRFANDPLGEMTIAEETIIDGEGSRTSLNRFGDYSQLTLDPTDNKTFWYTGEYVKSNNNWSTRVASFKIAPNFSNDLGVTTIDTPINGVLTNSETITVSLFNYGLDEQTNFPVSYQIDGGAIITETFTGSIPSSTMAQFSFGTLADFSNEGHTYSVSVTTDLSGDEDLDNDSVTQEITHYAPNDLGVLDIIAPVSGNNMGMETITVKVKNFGFDEQSDFDVSYTLHGGNPVTEQVAGPLAFNETFNYSFATQGDFSAIQGYNLSATTSLPGDANIPNNEKSVVIDNSKCYGRSINSSQSIGPDEGSITTGLLNVTQDYIVSDVNLTLSLFHDNVEDLDIYLISPDGTSVELSTDNGASGNDYMDTVFDDEASTPITSGSAPFTGSFQPEGNLSDFNGLSSLGMWTLEITDDSDLFGGNLSSVRIDICGTTTAGIYDDVVDSSDMIIKTFGNNHFEISLTTETYDEKLFIKVFNIFGQEVLSKPLLKINGSYTYPLDMDRAASGVYIIRMGDNSFGKIKRIIVE